MALPSVVQSAPRPILALAPMATLGHAGFRTLVHELGGCDLLFSEMISAEAFVGGTPFESWYVETAPDPSRLIFQLIGKQADRIVEAARQIGRLDCAGIDINFGCSAPHIRKAGGGIAWTADPDRACDLIARLREAVPAERTVSVKLRLGEGDEPDETLSFAHRLADAGADFLTIHPRRMKEGYARPARWSMIERFARELAIPVLGNGDVRTIVDYEAAAGTGVAGVMIGRGAVARPWIFRDIRAGASEAAGSGGAAAALDRAAIADRFHQLLELYQPPEFHHTRARRFHGYFLADMPFGARPAAQVHAMEGYPQIVAHVRRVLSGANGCPPSSQPEIQNGGTDEQ